MSSPPPPPWTPGEAGPDPELENRIMLLDVPFGSKSHVRGRERAAQWLLEHAEHSHPALLGAIAAGRAGPGAIALLGAFARADSIGLLSKLLTDGGPHAWEAAQALALHPQPAAAEALRLALGDPATTVAIAAADALAARGDAGECGALVAQLSALDPALRYHVVQAAARLGCLPAELLAQLARSDRDADVRTLQQHITVIIPTSSEPAVVDQAATARMAAPLLKRPNTNTLPDSNRSVAAA